MSLFRVFTGSSNEVTARREMPNTWKNSFQNVWDSARSCAACAQSLAKVIERCLISFQLNGILLRFLIRIYHG